MLKVKQKFATKAIQNIYSSIEILNFIMYTNYQTRGDNIEKCKDYYNQELKIGDEVTPIMSEASILDIIGIKKLIHKLTL